MGECMKLVKLKFKIIIGIVLFVVLVCAAYYEKYVIHLPSDKQKPQYDSVTSKFGYRTHPITRTARKFSFWY